MYGSSGGNNISKTLQRGNSRRLSKRTSSRILVKKLYSAPNGCLGIIYTELYWSYRAFNHWLHYKPQATSELSISRTQLAGMGEDHTDRINSLLRRGFRVSDCRVPDSDILRNLSLPIWGPKIRQKLLRIPRDTEIEEVDLSTVRYRPQSLDTLCELTSFSKKEIQLMYRGFKQGSPTGIVSLQQFKDIYQQFFPQGDSSKYACFVFNTFDRDGNGQISFEEFAVGLSILSKGSDEEKIEWIFQLYDIQNRGFIYVGDLYAVVMSIYDLLGKHVDPPLEDRTIIDHVNQIFNVRQPSTAKMDVNNDGIIRKDEFLHSCKMDHSISRSLALFDTRLLRSSEN